MRWLFALVFVLLAGSLGVSTALAQSPDDDEARSLYDAGREAFEAGRYDRALEHFQRAYELSGRPQLLYNIGQAADRLRHDAEALDAFDRYLASPEADESLRPQIEGRLAVLRAAVAEHAPRETTPVVDPPPPAPAHADDSGLGIGLLVAGGVLAAGGVAMLAIAATENATVQDAAPASAWADVAGHLDTANALAISGGVSLGLGVVGCVVGSIVLASGGGEASGSTSATLSIGFGSLTARGTF
jgi:tetratricopeptide (TPR) repeat protein